MSVTQKQALDKPNEVYINIIIAIIIITTTTSPTIYWGVHICETLFRISFNTQENQMRKLRNTEQVKGGQRRKLYPILFNCKTQALKICIILHQETMFKQGYSGVK